MTNRFYETQEFQRSMEAFGMAWERFGESLLAVAETLSAAMGRGLKLVFDDLLAALRPYEVPKRDPLSIPPLRWEYQKIMLTLWIYPLYAIYFFARYREPAPTVKELWEDAKYYEDIMEW